MGKNNDNIQEPLGTTETKKCSQLEHGIVRLKAKTGISTDLQVATADFNTHQILGTCATLGTSALRSIPAL